MAHAHIARLKAQVEELRAQGASDSELIKALSNALPRETLRDLYKQAVRENRTDLEAGIEKALFTPSYAGQHGTWAPNSEAAEHDIATSDITKARKREQAEKIEPVRKRMSNVRADLEGRERER